MLAVKELIKKIKCNFQYDISFLSCNKISFPSRISYLISKYLSILSNTKKIKYLGSNFFYDNKFTPALLEQYPEEILQLDKMIDLNSIKSILDVGANIGQWAYTLKKFFPKLEIYSFEPNKNIFQILEKNSSRFKNWKIYNYALGLQTGKRVFFYSPSASTEGSFYKENMHQNYIRKDIKSTSIEVIKLSNFILKKLKLPTNLDLVKIDVEGAELEVLKSLDLKFKYLYIEVSVNRKGTTLKDVCKLLKAKFKVLPKVLYYHLPSTDSACAEALILLDNENK